MSDEWGIGRVDLSAYLDWIGLGDRPLPVSVDTLHDLHAAHVRAIPFENVDVVLGTHPGLAQGRRGRRPGRLGPSPHR